MGALVAQLVEHIPCIKSESLLKKNLKKKQKQQNSTNRWVILKQPHPPLLYSPRFQWRSHSVHWRSMELWALCWGEVKVAATLQQLSSITPPLELLKELQEWYGDPEACQYIPYINYCLQFLGVW